MEKSFARNLGGLIRVRIGMLDRLMKAKREPVSDIDTAAADSLKVLDPERPIREADMVSEGGDVAEWPRRRHRLYVLSITSSNC